MSGPDSGIELINAMIRGGEKAVSDFSHISGGEWFDEAPEYFLTTYVAWSVGNLESTHALLEVSVDQTRKKAGATCLGRPASHQRRNGRFDVVVYWSNDKPRGAVELKSPIWSATENKIKPDIDELCAVLNANKDSTFQFCAYVYYASAGDPKRKHDNASQRLRELIARIYEKAIVLASKHGVEAISIPGSIHRGNDDVGGAWCIATLVFTREGGQRAFKNANDRVAISVKN